MLTGCGSQPPPILPGSRAPRDHADSDLRCYLAWCAGRDLDPFLARRPHLELYIRWMQEVRRPAVPAESPTLGFTHLQFEALLTAARRSANRNDFALVAMLGLLGLRIFEATSADIADLGEEHGHRVLRGLRQRRQGRPGPAATSGRTRHRPRHGSP